MSKAGTPVPTASFSAAPTCVAVGDTVTFTDGSTSSNPPITSWSWTFQEGTPDTSTAQNPTVVYNTTGIYSFTSVVQPSNHSTIDISNQPNGIYFVNINFDKGGVFKKIILQK